MLRYGFEIELGEMPFERALEVAKAALASEGFGVLTEIDMQRTLHEKVGAAIGRYAILGACNPHLAQRALEIEPSIGLLLPCNVVVRATDAHRSAVAIASPIAMFDAVRNPALDGVVEEATERMRRVAARIESASLVARVGDEAQC